MPPNHEPTWSVGRNTKTHQKQYAPIPEELDGIGKKTVDATYIVHKNLGPGLL
jgi:hypothetical protein